MSTESSELLGEIISLLQRLVEHNHQQAATRNEIVKSLGVPPNLNLQRQDHERRQKDHDQRMQEIKRESDQRRREDQEFQANLLGELRKQTALMAQLLAARHESGGGRAEPEQSCRTSEPKTLDNMSAHVVDCDELPTDLASAMRELVELDDQALWHTAQFGMAKDAREKIEELHLKRQREGLTSHETTVLADLMRQYERAMLVRAQAVALLHQRGHNIDSLRSQP
jgi:hypothetical protein